MHEIAKFIIFEEKRNLQFWTKLGQKLEIFGEIAHFGVDEK